MADDATPNSANVNLAFERAILGAALQDPDALVKVTSETRDDDYFFLEHKVVFRALQEVVDDGRDTVDVRLLARQLQRTGKFEDAEGGPHVLLATLMAEASPLSTLDERIEDVRACANGRSLYQVATAMAQAALEANGDPQAVAAALNTADEQIIAMSDRAVAAPWMDMDAVLEASQNVDNQKPILPTGFADLDRLLNGGLRAGQMVMVAARPAQGKTTLAMDLMRHGCIRKDIPGLMISLEMGIGELGQRMLSAEARVPLTSIRENAVTPADQDRLNRTISQVTGAPFYVCDDSEGTWPSIRGAIVAAHRRLGIKFAIIDYLQLVSLGAGEAQNRDGRQNEVATISRSIKRLALRLGIAIIAVAQLNRGPEDRTGHKPKASDLRESGQLEQDSDVIMLLFQPQTYDPNTSRAGEADVIVDKHRNGQTGVVPLAFQGHYSRFADLARDVDQARDYA